MSVETKVRFIFTLLVLVSFALGRFTSPLWLWLAAVVGLNLVQSAFTGFCPVETFFRSVSVRTPPAEE